MPTTNYVATQLREQLERGPYAGEDFFRLKVTGDGSTKYVNVTPEQLAAMIAVLDGTAAIVPVGILQRAGQYADALADFEQDDGRDEAADTSNAFARALYAASRGEQVDWSAIA